MKLLLTLLVLGVIGLTACGTGSLAFKDIKWALESYGEKGNPQPVLADTETTATFDSAKGQVTGSAGCNTYFGNYDATKSRLTIGAIAATEMYCLGPEGVMDQEQEYLKILGAAESYQIQDGKLQISSGNQLLIFKRR